MVVVCSCGEVVFSHERVLTEKWTIGPEIHAILWRWGYAASPCKAE